MLVFHQHYIIKVLTLIGLGIWIIVDTGSLSKHFEILDAIGEGDEDKALKYVSYIFIVVGAIIFIIGFCGCCGAIKEIRCLLGIYIAVMILLIAAEVACVALGFIYKDKVEEMIGDRAHDFFKNEYLGNGSASYSVRFIEYEFKCCGMNGPTDYKSASYGGVSEWCCKWGDHDYDEKDAYLENEGVCKTESVCIWGGKSVEECNLQQMHSEGCLEAILSYYPYFIGVALAIALFELIGIIFACCLCQRIGGKDI